MVTIIKRIPGSYTFVAPEGVTSIIVKLWGGGGKGQDTISGGIGTGGGGGGFSQSTVSVTPGNSYTYVVGGSAQNSTFNSTTVVAKCGSNGGGQPGAGATAGTGDITYTGGNGGSYIGWNLYVSGGGGGGAGTTGNGNNASNNTGGAAKSLFGGSGGNGTNSTGNGSNGEPGQACGGGGAGSKANTGAWQYGGAGGNGRAEIWYESDDPFEIKALVVAGGGGGGYDAAGGGGGGEVIYNPYYYVNYGTYDVTVGASVGQQTDGNNSVFGIITAAGGKKGANIFGVGGACPNTSTGGNGDMGRSGGGGGGANQNGFNASGSAGNGGIGLSCDISGSTVYYGGGGGGGTSYSNKGIGGLGGGGNGGQPYTLDATAGSPNTGGGGGGGGYSGHRNGGSGGSGIVILRWPTDYFDNVSITGEGNTITEVGDDSVATFIINGSITFSEAKTGSSSFLQLF